MDTLEKLVDGIIAAWNNHDPVEFAAQFSEDGVLRIVATGRSCAAARSSVQTLRPFFGGSRPAVGTEEQVQLRRCGLHHRVDADRNSPR